MMNEEDEAFNEIERRAKQRMEAVRAAMRVEDDDIQEYKKPWVGLTDEEIYEIYDLTQEKVNEHWESGGTTMMFPPALYKAIETKLKEKNT
jgi:hypothetical protein